MSGHSPPLRTALEQVRATMVDDDGLISEVEFETVLARARTGDDVEIARCLPRLLTALIDGELSPVEAIEVVELLDGYQEADVVTRVERRQVVLELLDAWWFDVLQRQPGEHRPGVAPEDVLGLLARIDVPMVRWLHPWLDSLDGPPAVHLAAAIIDGFPAPTWAGRSDERRQVIAWTRSEAVINGLALIGATHIDGDTMDRVLDILILGEATP